MMKRILLAALVPTIAQANDVIPNHIRFPPHSQQKMMASVSAISRPPSVIPNGLDAGTKIVGVPNNYPLSTFWDYIDSSVQQQSIGIANGVSGLDASGRVSNDVKNSNVYSGSAAVGRYSGGKYSTGPESGSSIISLGAYADENGNVTQLPGDLQGLNFELNRTVQIGGQRVGSWGHVFTYGRPYAGGMGAVVDGAFMNGKTLAQGTGVSAGTWAGMVGNGLSPGTDGYSGGNMNLDAAVRATETGSAPPLFVASSAFPDPDGTRHVVTFRANGADFSPALPAYWGRQIVPGMNIATNVIAATHVQGNNWNEPWLSDAYFRKAFNMFFGTVQSAIYDASGNVTGINLDNSWYLPQQTQAGYGTRSGLVPMRDTYDGSPAATLDTQFTNLPAPAIFFGLFTKAFGEYGLCAFSNDSPGDSAAPDGTKNSLVHECDSEYDFFNRDSRDYMNSIHGATYTVNNTNGGALTRDSYFYAAQGGGVMPLGMRIWNLLPGSITYQAMANGSLQSTNIYQPDAPALPYGSQFTSQAWQFASGGASGVNTSTLRLTQYRDIDSSNNPAADSSTTSIHLGYKVDHFQDARNENYAMAGGQVVWDIPNYRFSVGMCAGGNFQSPKCGVIVTTNGNANLPSGYLSTGGLNTDASYKMSSLPISGNYLSDGSHAWCSDCKVNGILGTVAYWHNSTGKWTDALNNPLSTQ